MSSELDPGEHRGKIGNTASKPIGEITRAQVRRYARAVGDDNPLFHDVEYARERGFADLVVPPNFPPAIVDQGTGAPADRLREDGVDPTKFPIEIPPEAVLMGGGQDLSFDRYVVAGETVGMEETFADLYQKESERMGTLTFIETVEEYFSGDERVLRCGSTTIVGDRQ